MVDLLVTVLVCGTIIYVVHEVKSLVKVRLEQISQTQQQEVKNAQAVEQTAKEPLPLHLYSVVNQWSEKWAREDMQNRLYELYDEYGDWDKVSAVVMPKVT